MVKEVIMDKYFDCFAMQNLGGKYSCKALRVMDCDGCSFFKTREQVKAERLKREQKEKAKKINIMY